MGIGYLETLGRVYVVFFTKKDDFCDFLFVFLHIKPLQKGVYSKRKEFAPNGSKFFPFRVDYFSVDSKTILTEVPPIKFINSS